MARSSPSPSASPSPTKRAAYFLLGAMIGGIIGYGLVTSGPGPSPSILTFPAAAWVFGLAAVCGLLGAASPDGFWRRSRYRSWPDRDD